MYIRSEIANEANTAQKVRVISTILDPAGKTVAKTTSKPALALRTGQSKSLRTRPAFSSPSLWSLEKRNRYTSDHGNWRLGGNNRRSLRNALWHTVDALRRRPGLLSE